MQFWEENRIGLGRRLFGFFFYPGLAFYIAAIAPVEDAATRWIAWSVMALVALMMLLQGRWLWKVRQVQRSKLDFVGFIAETERVLKGFKRCVLTSVLLLLLAWGGLALLAYQPNEDDRQLFILMFFLVFSGGMTAWIFLSGPKALMEQQPEALKAVQAVRVSPEQAPVLWEMIEETVHRLGCPLPDHVILGVKTGGRAKEAISALRPASACRIVQRKYRAACCFFLCGICWSVRLKR